MLAALCAMRSVGFPRPAPSLSRCKGRVLDLEACVKKAPAGECRGLLRKVVDYAALRLGWQEDQC